KEGTKEGTKETIKPDSAPANASLPQIAGIKLAVPLPTTVPPAQPAPASATPSPALGATKSMMGPPELLVEPAKDKEQAVTTTAAPAATPSPATAPVREVAVVAATDTKGKATNQK